MSQNQLTDEWQDPVDKFRFKRMTKTCNHYVVYPDSTVYAANAITMTGADVLKQINVPFPHRINKIMFTHLDAAKALSNNNLTVELLCQQKGQPNMPYYEDSLLVLTNTTASRITELFGTTFEYEARTWTLRLNAANGELVIPTLYLQLIGSGYT